MFYLLAETIPYVTAGGVAILAVSLSGWLLIHTRHHPVKKDIDHTVNQLWDKKQGTDVCDERTQRIEQAIGNVDSKVEKGFENIENLINKSG